jgi:hypothetical protein
MVTITCIYHWKAIDSKSFNYAFFTLFTNLENGPESGKKIPGLFCC